jgi:hypothetical protein
MSREYLAKLNFGMALKGSGLGITALKDRYQLTNGKREGAGVFVLELNKAVRSGKGKSTLERIRGGCPETGRI